MHRSSREHRDEFRDLGYTVFEGVLPPRDLEGAQPIFDALITPETAPPVVTGNDTARRQLNSAKYCEPRLSRFGGHPSVIASVTALMDRPFRLTRSPVPTVTYPGAAGGRPGRDWAGHVDWDTTGEVNVCHVYGIVHFSTVEPGGGGFTVVPGSHRIVATNLADPDATQRMLRQEFVDFPGMAAAEEICGRAGDVLYYHPLLVHGASDNLSDRARKVLHTHYFPVLTEAYETRQRATIADRFHPAHLAVMDDDFRRLIAAP